MKRTIAGLVLALWAQTALTAFLDGNKLLEFCTEGETSDYLGGFCAGYITAVPDAHRTWVMFANAKPKLCLPNGVNVSQLEQVVVKYLKENPENLHRDADTLSLVALVKAFPCK